jgi:hypothetical protein
MPGLDKDTPLQGFDLTIDNTQIIVGLQSEAGHEQT